jgi:hypothetical protein
MQDKPIPEWFRSFRRFYVARQEQSGGLSISLWRADPPDGV